MAHIHSVYDTDPHFKIDPVTRAIINQSETKTKLMQYDHNSERFTFEIPRLVDGHDMSLCNRIKIHYLNINASTKETNADVYFVDDTQLSPESDDVVIFSWLVSKNATMHAGSLNFLVRFVCVNGDTIDYAWSTDVHKGITIGDGIHNSATVVEEYTDVFAAWEKEIAEKYSGTGAAGGSSIEVVDPNTLTVEEFHTLSEKFLNGNVTILLNIDSSTRVIVHTVEYEGTEEYGRWGASALTTSATDDVDFSFAEFDLYNIRYNPYDNAVYFEKETRSYPKLYLHTITPKVESTSGYWGSFSFYSTKNIPIEDFNTASIYAQEIANGAIINKLFRDMSGFGDILYFFDLRLDESMETIVGHASYEYDIIDDLVEQTFFYFHEGFTNTFTHTIVEV